MQQQINVKTSVVGKNEVREVLNINRKDRTEGVGRLTDAQKQVMKLHRIHLNKSGVFSMENRARWKDGR